MILHRHIKHEKRFPLFFPLVELDDLIHAAVITYIFTHLGCSPVLISEDTLRKSEKRINSIPLPAGRIVGMRCHRLIPKRCQIRRQAVKLPCDVLLVRDASLRQERHGVPRQELELRIGGIPSAHGDIQISGNRILISLLQTMQIRHIIFVHGKIPKHSQIGK